MRPDDARLTRKVKAEIIRRELNTQKLNVSVLHGVCYLGGELAPTRQNRVTDWRKEFEIIENVIRTIDGVRDIVNQMKWIPL